MFTCAKRIKIVPRAALGNEAALRTPPAVDGLLAAMRTGLLLDLRVPLTRQRDDTLDDGEVRIRDL